MTIKPSNVRKKKVKLSNMTKMQSQHVMLVVSNVDKTIYQITFFFKKNYNTKLPNCLYELRSRAIPSNSTNLSLPFNPMVHSFDTSPNIKKTLSPLKFFRARHFFCVDGSKFIFHRIKFLSCATAWPHLQLLFASPSTHHHHCQHT